LSSVAEFEKQTAKSEAFLPRRAQTPSVLQPEHPLLHLQRSVGNQTMMRMLQQESGKHGHFGAPSSLLSPAILQRKLTINEPGDVHEQEADRVSEHVTRMPDASAAVHGTAPSIQLKTANSNTAGAAEAPPIVHKVLSSPGQPLDAGTRAFMEPRFGQDFSHVRVHTDAQAAKSAKAVGARAYTVGSNVAFGAGEHAPGTQDGQRLLAHELTHVVQQSGGAAAVQRRLLLTGAQADIDSFIDMSQTASGFLLVRNPITNEVTGVGSSATPATSPTYAARLQQIMDDPVQDAEIHVGTDQPNVDIGAFPTPADMTGTRVQNVDMDDILAMEAAPGIGVADLLHEIVENYEAHANAPVPGVDRFGPAHEAGLQAEAQVVEDIIGPGQRVAEADQVINPTTTRIAEDYDNFYVLSTRTFNPVNNGFTRSNVSMAAKVTVTVETANQFSTGSDVVPPGGAAAVAAAAAALAANPLATVRVEGFTDDTGTAARNQEVGRLRAASGVAALVAAGVDEGRCNPVSRGATGFVAPNNSDANRARNRRVVFTVTQPVP
jgi:outer membrane protein OmpA-like peptidoglycan-associated protein